MGRKRNAGVRQVGAEEFSWVLVVRGDSCMCKRLRARRDETTDFENGLKRDIAVSVVSYICHAMEKHTQNFFFFFCLSRKKMKQKNENGARDD